jgi:glutaryl-CoA dehydrogenase
MASVATAFTGVDFYDLDSLLTEEERAIRDAVRSWVDENLMPVIGDAYIQGKFPKQLIPGMAELGMYGANLPEEYGCAGVSNVAYGPSCRSSSGATRGSAPSPRCRGRW